jgi:hypothetical protein
VDESTGAVHLIAAYTDSNDTSARENGLNDLFQWTSSDHGVSFDKIPKNISHFFGATPRITPANGHGISIRGKSHHGRLVIPAYSNAGSSLLVSDDHGTTWMGTAPFSPGTAEGDVAELPNGTLLYALREDNLTMTGQCGEYKHCRLFATSDDGGLTFQHVVANPYLPDPGCKAGLAAAPSTVNNNSVLFFVNNNNDVNRTHITVRQSFNSGGTWSEGLLLYNKTAGYVDMVSQTSNLINVIYEKDTCEIVMSTVEYHNNAAIEQLREI